MEGWGREMEYHIESFFTYGRKGVERWNIIESFFTLEGWGREMEYHIESFFIYGRRG